MRSEWQTDDFGEMSWHDNHVHGLSIAEGADGAGELALDVDYILEWLSAADGAFNFRIGPAKLTFHEVTGLKIELDYGTPSAGITPFSLHGIEREAVTYPNGAATYRWRLVVNWPAGSIDFVASGFTQALYGTPIVCASQVLSPSERTACGA